MAARPLAGRVALVTGANHGIGAATATALAARGAEVAVAYLRVPPHAEAEAGAIFVVYTAKSAPASLPEAYWEQRQQDASTVLAAIEASGARGLGVEADFSAPGAPAELFDRVEEALGPVSILVNNASGWRPDTFGRGGELVSAETFSAQFLVDARGGALLIAEFASRHRRRGATWGRVVSLTSGGGLGFPGEVSYGAAKAALDHYTMSASVELAGDGITANAVHPPVTDTGWVTDEVRRFVAESDDHVNVAQPDEVAEVIAWLCTDSARLVTGNVLRLR